MEGETYGKERKGDQHDANQGYEEAFRAAEYIMGGKDGRREDSEVLLGYCVRRYAYCPLGRNAVRLGGVKPIGRGGGFAASAGRWGYGGNAATGRWGTLNA